MANTERNKQAVARLFEAFRAGDVEAFDELIVEDCVQHNPQAGNGLQAVKDVFAPVGPVDVEVHRVIAEGDLVAREPRGTLPSLLGGDTSGGWRRDGGSRRDR